MACQLAPGKKDLSCFEWVPEAEAEAEPGKREQILYIQAKTL